MAFSVKARVSGDCARREDRSYAFVWLTGSSEDEWGDENGEYGGESSPDISPSAKKKKKAGSPIKRVSSREVTGRAKKSSPKKKAVRETCFVMSCNSVKRRNSRFCAQHAQVDAGMRYQAGKRDRQPSKHTSK